MSKFGNAAPRTNPVGGLLNSLCAPVFAAALTAAAPAVDAKPHSAAPSATPRWTQLQKLDSEAAAAAQKGMVAREAEILQERLTLAPDNPRVLLELAQVRAKRGEIGEARELLDRFALLGLDFDAARYPALTGIPGLPEPLSSAPPPKGLISPRTVATLDGSGLMIAEGVATDPGHGRTLVSTVAARSLYAIDDDGRASRILSSDPAGGLFGMAVDSRRGKLWVAEASAPDIPGSGPESRTALVAIDLRSGRLLQRLSLPGAKGHSLNDVTVGPDHSVYAADARSGEIYRLAPGNRRLSVLVPSGWFGSTQGLAVTPDGKSLIVADYASGLYRVDLRSGAIHRLRAPSPAAMVGIDGLARCGGSLIATQNGIAPERVLRIALDGRGRAIRSVSVLAQGAGVHDITLGACSSGRFRYVADSQWQSAGNPAGPLAKPKLMELDLRRRRNP